MEKSRAIELLEHLAWDRDIDRNPCGDALRMAIDALKAQHSSEGTTKDTTSDLISRRAAIDALKEHRALYCDNTPETFSKLSYVEKSRVDELDTAIATLVNLPSVQPEPSWIPVSERLPEIGGEYLVSVRWYREDDIDINVYDYDARCKEWNDGESCGQRVIAWMPLPEAYKPNK